jgi:hypothetical protein
MDGRNDDEVTKIDFMDHIVVTDHHHRIAG